jgi:alpha-mannosidase
LPRLATELEMPPVTVTAAPHHGELPRTGSLASLAPETFRLLAIKPAQDGNGWIVRVQETAGKGGRPLLDWLGSQVKLDAVEAHRIASWRLLKKGGRWLAVPVSAQD